MADHVQFTVGHRPGRLLLRPALPLAARQQREHQRAAAPVLPQGHRPVRATARSTSTRSPPSSTAGPARPSAGSTPAQALSEALTAAACMEAAAAAHTPAKAPRMLRARPPSLKTAAHRWRGRPCGGSRPRRPLRPLRAAQRGQARGLPHRHAAPRSPAQAVSAVSGSKPLAVMLRRPIEPAPGMRDEIRDMSRQSAGECAGRRHAGGRAAVGTRRPGRVAYHDRVARATSAVGPAEAARFPRELTSPAGRWVLIRDAEGLGRGGRHTHSCVTHRELAGGRGRRRGRAAPRRVGPCCAARWRSPPWPPSPHTRRTACSAPRPGGDQGRRSPAPPGRGQRRPRAERAGRAAFASAVPAAFAAVAARRAGSRAAGPPCLTVRQRRGGPPQALATDRAAPPARRRMAGRTRGVQPAVEAHHPGRPDRRGVCQQRRCTRRARLLVPLVAAAGVGTSRVLLGVHWPTDVLTGWLFAEGWLGLAESVAPASGRAHGRASRRRPGSPRPRREHGDDPAVSHR